jgi:hypothetical protein
MKKVIALFSVVLCFATGSAMAQGGGGGGQQMTPEQRMAALKETLKPLGLTDVQNDSVVAIYSDRSGFPANMRELSQEDRAAKMKEISDARQKRMVKAGLSAEAAGKVVELMSQRRPGGGGGRQ